MERHKPPAWQTLLAFSIIYFIWGATFLAIRVGVREVPPLLFAAMRFLTAGVLLFGWTKLRGTPLPALREWRSASLLALLIFVFDYGSLFWAEQRVPSGLAAVMLATVPLFTAVTEILLLGTQKPGVRLALALLIGLAGVAALVSRSLRLGGAPIDTKGAVALIVAAASWSVSSVLNRKLPLPYSKPMSSAIQMLIGGAMLCLGAAFFGELGNFHPLRISGAAWLSLLYLIVAGSIIGFTAYLWLIHHESPTKVGTYAYVNPLVAVLIGHFLGGEALGARTILGTLCVLISVLILTLAPARGNRLSRRNAA